MMLFHIDAQMILAALILFVLAFLILQFKKWLEIMDDQQPDHKVVNVGDLKKLIKNLPDDMPLFLLDQSTDDRDNANYCFTHADVFIDDYYNFDTDDELVGNPAGKALFLGFENKLNDDPISNY